MIDKIDVQIIKCLKENARVNASVIGERISMSVSAVIERIRKLETNGIIQRYTVVLDSKKIGKDICAFISVSIEHPRFNESFSGSVRIDPRVVECHYITGDFDFLLKVMTGSTEELTSVLNSVKSIKGVSLTRTLIVLSTTKNESCVLPDAER